MPTKRAGTMTLEPDEINEGPVEVPEVSEEVLSTPPEPNPDGVEIEEDEDGEDPTPEPEEVVDLESLDPNEELWPGGPSVGQTLAWKQEYGEVWLTTINPYTNNYVLWRPLFRQEYRDLVINVEQAVAAGISSTIATMDNEEALTALVTLYPPYNRHNRAGTLAGTPQTIAQECMEISGFVAAEVRSL